MENKQLLEAYTEQRDCIYKGEIYTVRNNGAVLRHKPENKVKPRPLDGKWTFGKKNHVNGYMTIGVHRVHIIVATAFYGAHNSKEMVVDHIDTNRCNNRAENLRWLTKLENALKNPITLGKITYLCDGDINKFLDNPACLRDLAGNNQNVKWMCTVSAEDAKNAYLRIKSWQKMPPIRKKEKSVRRSMFEMLYSPVRQNAKGEIISRNYHIAEPPVFEKSVRDYLSLTPNVKQRNWRTPTMFPLCPRRSDMQTLECYAANLNAGIVITRNKYTVHYVDEFMLYEGKLYIRAHDADSDSVKPYSLITVSIEDGFFVHEGTTFFQERGAIKAFLTNTGREYTGPGGIDDCC